MESNIYSKQELTDDLKHVTKETLEFLQTVPAETFAERPIKDKWSIGEQVMHLILSAKPTVKAMGTQRMLLRVFGTNKGDSRTHNELYAAYKAVLAAGQVAGANYTPAPDADLDKDNLLPFLESLMNRLVERLEQWSPADLDKYCVKHPALGKITMREFMFFTVFHTRHHLHAIRQLAAHA